MQSVCSMLCWQNAFYSLWVFHTCWASLKSEWQLIFSVLQETLKYSSQSQSCWGLDSLDSSTIFLLLSPQSFFQVDYYYYFLSQWVYHTSFNWWVFIEVWVTASLHRSSRTLLSILDNLSGNGVWMVLTLLQISTSSSLFSRPSETLP